MTSEMAPLFYRFSASVVGLVVLVTTGRPIIDATTHPPVNVPIASEAAAAGPDQLIIQSVSVTQENWLDQIIKEYKDAKRTMGSTTATVAGGTDADQPDDSESVSEVERPVGQISDGTGGS